MKTFKFMITAKIVKIIEVEIDDSDKTEDEALDAAREEAHETFSPLSDGFEESYTEDSEWVY